MKSSKDRLIAEVARYARVRAGRVTWSGFVKESGVSQSALRRWFPEGFYGLLKAAGLAGRVGKRRNIPDDELMAEYGRVRGGLGRRPTWRELTGRGRYAHGTYARRFENLEGLEEAWRAKGQIARVRDGQIEASVSGRGVEGEQSEQRKTNSEQGRGAGAGAAGKDSAHPPAPSLREVERPNVLDFPHGAPLGFRGLVHAPTCEAGVVHLFGLLGPELGLAIVSVRQAYPDCLALRPSKVSPGQWEPVIVEFEFRSSNFGKHGHDVRDCDLIVCWEDDWPECPVRVLELRAELEKVRKREAA